MQEAKNIILFPVDFQKYTHLALNYAEYFAGQTGAGIHMLHVLEEGNMLERMFTTEEQQARAFSETEKLLKHLKEKINKNISVRTEVVKGKVCKNITEAAKSLTPRFILIGKSQESAIAQSFLGSNAVQLLRETKYPVVTIRGAKFETSEIKNTILIPVDLTKEIHEQLTAAIEFGYYFKSKVYLLSILTVDSIGLELQLVTRLHKAKTIVEEAGLECKTNLVKDTKTPVHKTILNIAHSENVQLIVIMTRDETRTTKAFVGHIAHDILDMSDTPVMTLVPSSPEESVFSHFVDPFGILKTKM